MSLSLPLDAPRLAAECEEFFASFTDDAILHSSGMRREHLCFIYCRYCGPSTRIPRVRLLYELFVFFKAYPIARMVSTVFPNRGESRKVLDELHRAASYLATVIDELTPNWEGPTHTTHTTHAHTYPLTLLNRYCSLALSFTLQDLTVNRYCPLLQY